MKYRIVISASSDLEIVVECKSKKEASQMAEFICEDLVFDSKTYRRADVYDVENDFVDATIEAIDVAQDFYGKLQDEE